MNKINTLIVAGIFLSLMLVSALLIPGVVKAQYYTGLCTPHSSERCLGNNLYWYDSCGNLGDLAQYCPSDCYNNSCQNYNNNNYNNYNCTSNYQQRCSGNNLYWYDSCGTQQTLVQVCPNGCYNGICTYDTNNYNSNYNYNYNNYGNCTYHAYKLCVGNNIFWYDSCGTQQDLYYGCGSQTCQYGQCIAYIQPPIQPQNSYTAYNITACYNNSLYWYDSLGVASGLYKSCADNNSCTQDTCATGKCYNTMKCDGSTCATGSADYNSYCLPAPAGATNPPVQPNQPILPVQPISQSNCGNGLCEPAFGENITSCPSDCKINSASGLSISFFTKQNANSTQWQKVVQVGPNSKVYFMVTVTNSSAVQADSVNISASIPAEISSLGNLQVNNVLLSGDITSGINIGSVSPLNTKSVTFEGKTQAISNATTQQATVTTNAAGAPQTDTISISLDPNQATAAVSSAPETPGFVGFLQRWYVWILGGLILVILFFFIFRRLSADV